MHGRWYRPQETTLRTHCHASWVLCHVGLARRPWGCALGGTQCRIWDRVSLQDCCDSHTWGRCGHQSGRAHAGGGQRGPLLHVGQGLRFVKFWPVTTIGVRTCGTGQGGTPLGPTWPSEGGMRGGWCGVIGCWLTSRERICGSSKRCPPYTVS